MGMLTGTWTDTDTANVRDLQQQQNELNAEIAGYRRKRGKKTCKPTVQFRSFKDPKKKPSRVMWIHRNKKKRKSRLAKVKYGYMIGNNQRQPFYWDEESEFNDPYHSGSGRYKIVDRNETQISPSRSKPGETEDEFLSRNDTDIRAINRWTEPQVYEGAYRRKRPKKKSKKSKIVWFRNKKERKSKIAKQKYGRRSDYSPNWRWAKKEEPMYYPEPHNDFAAQTREDYLKSFQPKQSTADILASEGVDTVYRRKRSKKKQKKRNRKK
jgi:hypothetical protein